MYLEIYYLTLHKGPVIYNQVGGGGAGYFQGGGVKKKKKNFSGGVGGKNMNI